MCWLPWNLGASTVWNPQSLFRPVMGVLYLLLYINNLALLQKYEDKNNCNIQITNFLSVFRRILHKPLWHHRVPSDSLKNAGLRNTNRRSRCNQLKITLNFWLDWGEFEGKFCIEIWGLYEDESIIVRTVYFIFRKSRAVDQTGESEGVRLRLYRGCSNTSKFSFLRF
jgi:hypothetical protein